MKLQLLEEKEIEIREKLNKMKFKERDQSKGSREHTVLFGNQFNDSSSMMFSDMRDKSMTDTLDIL